jgi:hypothetical protein
MKVYRNSDGSYDVVNSKNVLFHIVHAAKKVGHVNANWKHHSRQLRRIPKHVMELVNIIED